MRVLCACVLFYSLLCMWNRPKPAAYIRNGYIEMDVCIIELME